jgi:hypothetical protein
VFRGLRLIAIGASKVAGKRKMDHASAMDFEAAPGRIELPIFQGRDSRLTVKG